MGGRIRIHVCLVSVLYVVCSLANSAPASVMVFTERGAFQTAAANAGLTITQNPLSTNPGTTLVDDGAGNVLTGALKHGIYSASHDRYENASGSDVILLWDLTTAGTVHGFGFDFTNQPNTPLARLRMDGYGVGTEGEYAIQGDSRTSGFLGILSTDGTKLFGGDHNDLMSVETGSCMVPGQTMDNLILVTPEPTTCALLALGFGLAAWRRRRN